MLSFGGTWLYETSPFHRYQAEALSQGHFYLSDTLEAMQPGLAWHASHIQQVWGLGVGLWLLPFQAVWHLFGGAMFPDRIALGLAFALLAFFSGNTGLKFIKNGQRYHGLGIIWLMALCPALWTLTRASQLVFEETVLYSVLLSLGILVSLIRVAFFCSRLDYIFCCGLSAFAIWMRPTHAVYGFGAVAIASLIVWLHRRSWKEVIGGTGGWIVSLILLLWTNSVRFGSPSEFGHHLTVSSGCMMYLTRFGNPFHEASLCQATRELMGLLFFAEPHGANTFSDHLVSGQAPFTRWRRLDLTTFDFSYALLCLASLIGAFIWLASRYKRNGLCFWRHSKEDQLIIALFLWSGCSMSALLCFYLYYPAMASRYLFDFAPAFAGFVFLAWCLLPSRWYRFSWPLLATWLTYEIASAQIPSEQSPPASSPIQRALQRSQGFSLTTFKGCYTPDNFPTQTKISGNGYGWEPETGIAADVMSIALDQPKFIELHVSERRKVNGEQVSTDVYRAQIDGVSLPLLNISRQENNLIVTFDVPQFIQQRHQNEMLFLCFSRGYDVADRDSERFMYALRWHE